jgi:hypothetical protein
MATLKEVILPKDPSRVFNTRSMRARTHTHARKRTQHMSF